MLNKRGLVTAGLCCCVSVFGWTRHAEAAPKVDVCHFSAGDGVYFTINVNVTSVAAHLAHGDCIANDGVKCTADSCEAGGCVHAPNDGACDDGNACTSDSCDPASGCVYTPIVCDDGDACTTDSCDPATGCVYTPSAVCGDGVVCAPEECESDSDCQLNSTCIDCVCVPNDPECEGASCATFVPCNPDSGCDSPVCGSIVEGGGACVEGNTPCASLAPCTTSADCPGSFCFTASCCGIPVCGPPFCPSPGAAAAVPAPGNGPTFGGQ